MSPVWFAVPPSGYGGIEWIVSLLADGLVDAGHEVTLFASGDSNTKARLESVYSVAPSEWIGHTYWELRHAVSCLVHSDEFDVISDHTGLLGLALGSMGQTPFAHTVHGPVSGDPGVLYEQVVAMAPRRPSSRCRMRSGDQDRTCRGSRPAPMRLTCPSIRLGRSEATTSSSSVA